MKKKLSMILAIVLALALCCGLVGCGGTNEPAAQNTPQTQNPTEPDDTVEEYGYYEFTLSMHDPVTTPNAVYFQEWADAIFAATDGHVKITIFGSSTLSAATDVADNVKAGACDIGWLYTSYYAGQFPLTDVINLPMQGFGDPIVSTEVLWSLYNEYDEVKAEWDDFKLLFLYGNPGMIFASAKTPIQSLADLQGMQLRCPAGAITEVLAAWGASPITMPPPDIYQAIEKNNIQGYIFEPSGITNFSLQDVTKYYTDLPMYDGPFGLIMNMDQWNSLPQEYKDIIDGLSGYAGSIGAAECFAGAVSAARDVITAAGGEFVTVSDEAIAEFRVEADRYAEKWAAGLTGVDGIEFLAKAKELAQ